MVTAFKKWMTLRLVSSLSLFPSSPTGLFMRHMLLAYNKLSFSQVFKLYKSLQQYCNKDRWATPSSGPQAELPSSVNEDMELTSTEDTSVDRVDGMDREEPDAGPLHQSELW